MKNRIKNKNKNKKIIIIISLIIIFACLVFLTTLYYLTSTVNNYSFTEKNWISKNVDKKIDIYVEPNLPVFSYNGYGVFLDFVKSLEEDTGLSFNILTSNNSNIKLENKTDITSNDFVFYKDHYVVLANDKYINKLSELTDCNIGIIETNVNEVKYYLTNNSNVSIKTYDSFGSMNSAYVNKEIDYFIVPLYKNLQNIIDNELDIIFHLDDLNSYYTLSISDDNGVLVSVFDKFFYKWQEKRKEKINEYFLDIYFSSKKYTEIEIESITNDDFIVGYIDNLPYEGMIRRTFTGLTNTYLEKFSEISGTTYKYIEYDNVNELNNALISKKVDIVLNYYSLKNNNYYETKTLGSTDYVVLAHIDNNIVVNSLYGLKNKEVVMLSNMNLKYNMSSKNLFEINAYDNLKDLFRNIDEESIIIVEKEMYDYYKDSRLKKYSIRFIDNIKLNNSFLLLNSNESFNNLFNFYLTTTSHYETKTESVEGVIQTLKNNRVFNFVISNLIYIVLFALTLALIVFLLTKRITKIKKEKKEERLYYFDTMTNLKNRNYLNDNMALWSSSKVYPQTIIVIDINNLKDLNEKGYEIGDEQIKSVASVLIKTQRDNSEIMRSDGDEFIIYLVGYEDKQISSYIHKLNKEFNNSLADKEYGVTIGYSMIKNELTSINDAINESIEMIKKIKGK